MSVTITQTPNTSTVLIDVTKLEGTTERALKNALHEIGGEVKRETQRLIKTGARTGRVYRFRGRDHTASAPGEAPANRSGRLAQSTRFKTKNHQEMTIGQEAEYAGFLKEGRGKLKGPRDSIGKAVHNKAQDTVNTILEHVKRETGA
jgi:hypothetical protein